MSRLPLGALEGFVAAARSGNLSRAAAGMNLTVSALSHQMRGLEARLGQVLLRRGARGVALTEDGERLLAAVEGPLRAIEQALRKCGARGEDTLSVSLMPSMASSWLVPRLPGFVARHPQVQVNLQSTTDLVDFARDDVDVALRFGGGHWAGVHAEHLFDEWITPVASPRLAKSLGKARLADLAGCPLLGDPGNRWPAWFEAHGNGKPPSRFVANFSDSETLHRAAVAGLGVALGRMTLARPLIEAGHLKALSRQRLRAEYAHYLVWPERAARKPAVQLFRDWVIAQARS
jgi:LysR family transcriptional regulator, glycine cleavage system transcriptional activator